MLWDIDGTLLVGATDAHRAALHAALLAVHGVDATEAIEVATAGRTDLEIARELLARSGVRTEEIDARAEAVRATWEREHAGRLAADLRETVVPGVAAVLAELAARSDARNALLTGNLEPIARAKLAAAGIGDLFEPRQGAFGSDAEDRGRLPAIARTRAGRAGVSWPRERTIVIGDTPLDIDCARADGVRCLAVATGSYGVDELGEAHAVARDASELGDRLAALL